MRKITKLLSSVLVIMVIFFNSESLSAQNDAFFYERVEVRNHENIDEYSYGLYGRTIGNGFSFNNFNSGNNTDGFNFGNFNISTDAVPVGNGIFVLSIAAMIYAQRKRNRK